MTPSAEFNSGILAEQLTRLEEVAGVPERLVVAYSGGLDSTVLLHALSALRQSGQMTKKVHAVHIDHGLHDESANWSRHCVSSAAAMGIELSLRQVVVPTDSGKGLEGAARDARYAALEAELQHGDWLLSAHHRDDQAETLLMNLIRGSGAAGIAGIGGIRRLGPGWLARPMLNTSRTEILDYATKSGLTWVDDPANTDQRFDRNFLRHEVLPTIASRWPDAAKRLQRSSAHASEASQLMIELGRLDLASLGMRADRLPIDKTVRLSPARQRNLIRCALRESGLPMPTTVLLQRIIDEVIPAREDAQPHVAWSGAAVRRYRNNLYLLPENLSERVKSVLLHNGAADLGTNLGCLELVYGASVGLSEVLVERGLRVEARIGGEEFRPSGQIHTRKLKKLLQEEGIVPWMRDRLPLVYCGSQLVAVGDLWLAADAASEPGVALRWNGRPALH